MTAFEGLVSCWTEVRGWRPIGKYHLSFDNVISATMIWFMYGLKIGRRCYCLGLTVLFCTIFYLFSALPTLLELAELHTCPACFGTSLCPDLLNGDIVLADLNSMSNLVATLGTKNVFFAVYKEKNVVIKKLGHLSELRKLDETLCDAANLPSDCEITEAVNYLSDIPSSIMRLISQPIKRNSQVLNSFHLCPSSNQLNLLLKNIIDNNKNVSLDVALMNLWTIFHINAEPIILQILPPDEGWPVPKYVGACGRFIVEEYVGQSLSELTRVSWTFRTHLSKQLLTAAQDFTYKHPSFRFYITDMSLDNIAVDAAGNIKFIDLENLIVVEKQPPAKAIPSTWNIYHVSENYDCQDCFAFSPDDICSHSVSDHNYYAVCQELLIGSTSSHGLLAHIPPDALRRHPEIPELLQQCAHSPDQNGRESAALRLISVFETETSLMQISR